MQFSTSTKWSEALKEGFKGHAVPVRSVFWHLHSADAIETTVNHKLAQFSGPVYQGEAEAHLLFPLLEWASLVLQAEYQPGTVVAAAYDLSAMYATIYRIMRVMNFKEAADAITREAVMATPIISSITALQGDEVPQSDKLGAWSRFWLTLNTRAVNAYGDKNELNDPTTLLAYMLSDRTSSVDPTTPINIIYHRITQYLHMGKGHALAPRLFAQRVSELNGILQAIGKLKESMAGDAESSAAQADMYVLGVGLLMYLDSIDHYDAEWTNAPISSTRDAYPIAIQAVAERLAGSYLYLATLGLSYDLRVAQLQWDELFEFVQEALPNTSDISDLKEEWQSRVVAVLDKVAPSLSSQVATAASQSVKQWTGADSLIRPDWLPQLVSAIDAMATPSADVPTPNEILMATNALLDDSNKFRILGQTATLLPILQERAATIADLVSGLAAMVDLITSQALMSYSKDQPPVDALMYHAPIGKLQEPAWETYDLPAPYEAVIEPWVFDMDNARAGANNIRTWHYKEILFSPRMSIPYAYSQTAKGAQLYWPERREFTAGTPSTAKFYTLPLPDVYTRSRTLSSIPFSYSGFEQVIRAQSDDTPTLDEYFRLAATLIVNFPTTQGQSVVDALSSLFIITVQGGENAETRLASRLPFIFGAPTEWVHAQNYAMLRSPKYSNLGWFASQLVEKEDGSAVEVCFHALVAYPIPTGTTQLLAVAGRQTAIGVSASTMIALAPANAQLGPTDSSSQGSVQRYMGNDGRERWVAARQVDWASQVPAEATPLDDELAAILDPGSYVDGRAYQWSIVRGYSPFRITLGAASSVGRDRDSLWDVLSGSDAMIKMAIAVISKHWRPLSKLFDLGIFTHDPLLLVTPDDYREFMANFSVKPPFSKIATPERPEEAPKDVVVPVVPSDPQVKSAALTSDPQGSRDTSAISGVHVDIDSAKLSVSDQPISGDPASNVPSVAAEAPSDAPDASCLTGFIINRQTKQARPAKSTDSVPDGWEFVTALPDGFELIDA